MTVFLITLAVGCWIAATVGMVQKKMRVIDGVALIVTATGAVALDVLFPRNMQALQGAFVLMAAYFLIWGRHMKRKFSTPPTIAEKEGHISVNLAVWEGPRPASDAEALNAFEALYDRYIDTDSKSAPSERISAYVAALLARYPDLTELDDDCVDDSPWADGPLIGNAGGPFIYFGFVPSGVEKGAWTFAVDTAREHGLVCFDPQSGTIAK